MILSFVLRQHPATLKLILDKKLDVWKCQNQKSETFHIKITPILTEIGKNPKFISLPYLPFQSAQMET